MAIEAGGMEIGTMVDDAGMTSVEGGHHLRDATIIVEDRMLTAGTEVTKTEVVTRLSIEDDRDRLTVTDDRTLTGTEARALMDVDVRIPQVISLTFLAAMVTTSLMFRFL